MSEYADESALTPEQLAKTIDEDFQFVAERLPTDIKVKPAGTTIPLCHIEGVGQLATTYVGKTRTGSDPLENFVVRVSMVADGYDGMLGFYKDYALTHDSYNREGRVIDKQPTTLEDFDGCPAPVETLAFVVHALTDEFERLYAQPEAQVIKLEDYRSAETQ
jgi:hypothetical protein